MASETALQELGVLDDGDRDSWATISEALSPPTSLPRIRSRHANDGLVVLSPGLSMVGTPRQQQCTPSAASRTRAPAPDRHEDSGFMFMQLPTPPLGASSLAVVEKSSLSASVPSPITRVATTASASGSGRGHTQSAGVLGIDVGVNVGVEFGMGAGLSPPATPVGQPESPSLSPSSEELFVERGVGVLALPAEWEWHEFQNKLADWSRRNLKRNSLSPSAQLIALEDGMCIRTFTCRVYSYLLVCL